MKKAHANLTAVGAITSQFSDLEATATPDADTSKYIQPVRTTTGKDAKHTTYTVNTVIEKCYRESGTMIVEPLRNWVLTGMRPLAVLTVLLTPRCDPAS